MRKRFSILSMIVGILVLTQALWCETGDFNGDGHSDILFKQENGNHNIWLMDETGKIGQIFVGKSTWTVEGVADFNDDNNTDILFKQDNGAYNIWLIDETGKIGISYIGIRNNWSSIEGIGDFNGDGSKDILYKEKGGAYRISLMDEANNEIDTIWLMNKIELDC